MCSLTALMNKTSGNIVEMTLIVVIANFVNQTTILKEKRRLEGDKLTFDQLDRYPY